jgi:hypothetical protein
LAEGSLKTRRRSAIPNLKVADARFSKFQITGIVGFHMKFLVLAGLAVLVVFLFNRSSADPDPYMEAFMQQCAGHGPCEDAVEERYESCSQSALSPEPDWDAYFQAQLTAGAGEEQKRDQARKIVVSGKKYLSEVGACISEDKGFKFRL